MWPTWRRSPGRLHTLSNFSCSSFKDIQNLCKEELEPIAPKKSIIFQRVRIANAVLRTLSCPILPESLPPLPPLETKPSPPLSPPPPPPPDPGTPIKISLPGAEKSIVVYYTSLRVVRKTFEDCRTVRSILKGFRVSIDERDLSMDAGFLEELQSIFGTEDLTLPSVFIGGRYVGGAEEIRQLHETGELKKLVEGFPAAEAGVCEECGGNRFVLCDQCNGSHKCYMEKGGFKICPACNVNGLIRCPSCYSSVGVDLPNLKTEKLY